MPRRDREREGVIADIENSIAAESRELAFLEELARAANGRNPPLVKQLNQRIASITQSIAGLRRVRAWLQRQSGD